MCLHKVPLFSNKPQVQLDSKSLVSAWATISPLLLYSESFLTQYMILFLLHLLMEKVSIPFESILKNINNTSCISISYLYLNWMQKMQDRLHIMSHKILMCLSCMTMSHCFIMLRRKHLRLSSCVNISIQECVDIFTSLTWFRSSKECLLQIARDTVNLGTFTYVVTYLYRFLLSKLFFISNLLYATLHYGTTVIPIVIILLKLLSLNMKAWRDVKHNSQVPIAIMMLWAWVECDLHCTLVDLDWLW